MVSIHKESYITSQIFSILCNQDSMSVQFPHCRLFMGFHRNILENDLDSITRFELVSPFFTKSILDP